MSARGWVWVCGVADVAALVIIWLLAAYIEGRVPTWALR